MFEIVKLKSDVYLKRIKAENFNANENHSSEEIIQHEIEKIREGLFNLSFEETNREIIHKFQLNFQKLKTFMESIDKGISELKVFNHNISSDPVLEEDKGMTSVVQVKELLRNYEGIVES
jgi:hypothetical protein